MDRFYFVKQEAVSMHMHLAVWLITTLTILKMMPVQGLEVQSCSGDYIDIFCRPDQTLLIEEAVYGPVDELQCGSDSNVTCSTHNAKANIIHRCSGVPGCSFRVEDDTFGSLCSEGSNALLVKYHCIPGSSVADICDLNTDQLPSDTGYIKSPGYSSFYPKNSHCALQLPQRETIQNSVTIEILDVSLKQDETSGKCIDHLTLSELTSSAETLTLCGEILHFTSYHFTQVRIEFNSSSVQYWSQRGFLLKYTISKHEPTVTTPEDMTKGTSKITTSITQPAPSTTTVILPTGSMHISSTRDPPSTEVLKQLSTTPEVMTKGTSKITTSITQPSPSTTTVILPTGSMHISSTRDPPSTEVLKQLSTTPDHQPGVTSTTSVLSNTETMVQPSTVPPNDLSSTPGLHPVSTSEQDHSSKNSPPGISSVSTTSTTSVLSNTETAVPFVHPPGTFEYGDYNAACMGEMFRITCPVSHTIVITEAEYGLFEDSPCKPASNTRVCKIQMTQDIVNGKCSGQSPCSFEVNVGTFLHCDDSGSVLNVKHRCVPVDSIFDVCDTTTPLPLGEGFITSSGYPSHYPSKLDCFKSLDPGPLNTIMVNVYDMSLTGKDRRTGCTDYVRVSEPGNVGETYNYCGDLSTFGLQLEVMLDILNIEFYTDGVEDTKRRGFLLGYKVIPKEISTTTMASTSTVKVTTVTTKSTTMEPQSTTFTTEPREPLKPAVTCIAHANHEICSLSCDATPFSLECPEDSIIVISEATYGTLPSYSDFCTGSSVTSSPVCTPHNVYTSAVAACSGLSYCVFDINKSGTSCDNDNNVQVVILHKCIHKSMVIDICGSQTFPDEGYIVSPDYPKAVQDRKLCYRRLVPSSSEAVISYTVKDLDMYYKFSCIDRLAVHNTNNSKDQVSYCSNLEDNTKPLSQNYTGLGIDYIHIMGTAAEVRGFMMYYKLINSDSQAAFIVPDISTTPAAITPTLLSSTIVPTATPLVPSTTMVPNSSSSTKASTSIMSPASTMASASTMSTVPTMTPVSTMSPPSTISTPTIVSSVSTLTPALTDTTRPSTTTVQPASKSTIAQATTMNEMSTVPHTTTVMTQKTTMSATPLATMISQKTTTIPNTPNTTIAQTTEMSKHPTSIQSQTINIVPQTSMSPVPKNSSISHSDVATTDIPRTTITSNMSSTGITSVIVPETTTMSKTTTPSPNSSTVAPSTTNYSSTTTTYTTTLVPTEASTITTIPAVPSTTPPLAPETTVKSVSICSGEIKTLSCSHPDDIILIESAAFHTYSESECGDSVTTTDICDTDIIQDVNNLCTGYNTCDYMVEDRNFPEEKCTSSSVLFITYRCSQKPVDICSGTPLPTSEGLISSMNYPEPYVYTRKDCIKTLTPSSSDATILTRIYDMDVEKRTGRPGCHDYLILKEYNNPMKYYPYCGNLLTSTYELQQTFTNLTITFRADSSTHLKGFLMYYKVIGDIVLPTIPPSTPVDMTTATSEISTQSMTTPHPEVQSTTTASTVMSTSVAQVSTTTTITPTTTLPLAPDTEVLSSTLCSGEFHTVSCPDDFHIIIIESAQYGVFKDNQCGSNMAATGTCDLDIIQEVSAQCSGLKECTFAMENYNFPRDKCNRDSALVINYRCYRAPVDICSSEVLAMPEGLVASRNYPKDYSYDQKQKICSKTITPKSSNATILTRIYDLDVEKRTNQAGCFDVLYLRDYDNPGNYFEVCGNLLTTEDSLQQTFKNLTISFQPDSSTHGKGFLMFYKVIGDSVLTTPDVSTTTKILESTIASTVTTTPSTSTTGSTSTTTASSTHTTMSVTSAMDSTTYLPLTPDTNAFSISVCLGESMSFSCHDSSNVLLIESASFGLYTENQCGRNVSVTGTCDSDILLEVAAKCSGHRECDFTVDSSNFPSTNCGKSSVLAITYRCFTEPVKQGDYLFSMPLPVFPTEPVNICSSSNLPVSEGLLASQNYPESYAQNKDQIECSKRIEPHSENATIVTRLYDLDLETNTASVSCSSSLILMDRKLPEKRYEYCGNMLTVTEPLQIEFQSLDIVFQPNSINRRKRQLNSANEKGFLLYFKVFDDIISPSVAPTSVSEPTTATATSSTLPTTSTIVSSTKSSTTTTVSSTKHTATSTISTTPSTISPITTKPSTNKPVSTTLSTTTTVSTTPSTTTTVSTTPSTTTTVSTTPSTTTTVSTTPSTTTTVSTTPSTTVSTTPSTTTTVSTTPSTTTTVSTTPSTTTTVSTTPSTTTTVSTTPSTTTTVSTTPSTTTTVSTTPSTTTTVSTTPSTTTTVSTTPVPSTSTTVGVTNSEVTGGSNMTSATQPVAGKSRKEVTYVWVAGVVLVILFIIVLIVIVVLLLLRDHRKPRKTILKPGHRDLMANTYGASLNAMNEYTYMDMQSPSHCDSFLPLTAHESALSNPLYDSNQNRNFSQPSTGERVVVVNGNSPTHKDRPDGNIKSNGNGLPVQNNLASSQEIRLENVFPAIDLETSNSQTRNHETADKAIVLNINDDAPTDAQVIIPDSVSNKDSAVNKIQTNELSDIQIIEIETPKKTGEDNVKLDDEYPPSYETFSSA